MPVRMFEVGGGENRNGDGGEERGGGDLNYGEGADGMMFDVTADDDHVQREGDGAAENDGIAAIEAAEAFGRDRQEIESCEGPDGAGPNPFVDATLAEEPEKQRDDHDAGAGDESGFRGCGEAQAGGLERVTGKHKKADLRAGPHCR